MLADFIKGFRYLLQGFQLIRQPQLRHYVWLPLLCNIILFTAMIIFAAYGINHFSQWVEGFLPNWLHWLRWLIFILSELVSSIILFYLSTLLVNLIAAPFNSLLSENVLILLNANHQIQPVSNLRAMAGAFKRQLQFLGYYIPRALFFLVLFIIPVVQVAAAVLWFLFNAWVFAIQYLDYPMDLGGTSLLQMRKLMREKRGVCLGFGAGVVLFTLIPLVNLVIVPVAVVGATILWAREYYTAPS